MLTISQHHAKGMITMPLTLFLVCSFGMSTSIIEDSVKEAAAERNTEICVQSIGTGDVKKHVEQADVFLLGPQVRYAESHIRELGKPVAVIDAFVYATSNGAKILDQAIRLAGKSNLS
jgi:PTS system cellobiose-specific IIB component